jgi:hypothetical protein
LPRRSIFPDFPVVLDPPEGGVRIGLRAPEARPDEAPVPRPFAARLVAVFLIAGGVWAFVNVIGFLVVSQGLCCLWLPMFLELPWGVAAVVRGGQLLFLPGRPRTPVIMVLLQMHLCFAFDVVNTLLGFFNLLMLCAPKARAYFRNEWGE